MTTTTTIHHYAISWAYGRACDDQGNRIGTYHRFDSRAERDAWVEDGASYTTEPGFREAIPASDSEIRRINREHESGSGWGWSMDNTSN